MTMQNEMRDRLVELIEQALIKRENLRNDFLDEKIDDIPDFEDVLADHLIENGVIVPPCKVGDIVYVVSRYYAGDWEVYKCKIDNLTIYGKNTFISCDANTEIFEKINFGLNVSEIGKTVFFTKEEAEQKLKEGAKE